MGPCWGGGVKEVFLELLKIPVFQVFLILGSVRGGAGRKTWAEYNSFRSSRGRKPWSAHCELKHWNVRRPKVPNSRFAPHGLAPSKCTVDAPCLPGLCAFCRPLLTPASTTPFFVSLSINFFFGLHFTIYSRNNSIWVSKTVNSCKYDCRNFLNIPEGKSFP